MLKRLKKKTKLEVKLVNSVIANVKTNSESEYNKLLAIATFLQLKCYEVRQDRKVRKVEKKRIGKDGQKIMLKRGENMLVSSQRESIMYYVKKRDDS